MSAFTVQPGSRVMWCLRRRASDVRCVLFARSQPISIQILQDRDIVLTELFPEEWLAEKWAVAYAERLRQQGWQDSPSATASGV